MTRVLEGDRWFGRSKPIFMVTGIDELPPMKFAEHQLPTPRPFQRHCPKCPIMNVIGHWRSLPRIWGVGSYDVLAANASPLTLDFLAQS